MNAREEALYRAIRDLRIVSPHGHTDPAWFADDRAFADPAALLIVPDHYVFRMLYSQGVPMEALGIGVAPEARDPRAIWGVFAAHWHLFLGTPSRGWLEHTFRHVFGIEEALSPATAGAIYDRIDAALAAPEFRPRAILERFGIAVLATTDAALDDLKAHAAFAAAGHPTRLIPTFRPDGVLNPAMSGFAADVARLGEIAGEDTATMPGYLAALRDRRAHFRAHGATASDHDVPDLATEWLGAAEAEALLGRALSGRIEAGEAVRFYNHMLVEMAQMSVDDGLVMQIHAGNRRSTNRVVLDRFGRDMGADIPHAADWVHGLDALLNRVGNDPAMRLIAFTLDESVYARELAPMAGHWPALRLGPPWWFHDSPNGIARYFDAVIETAGYWNLAGFNDDTRALMSIPARHDMWRRSVARHLAGQVDAGRFGMAEAERLAPLLGEGLARDAYRLEGADA